MPEISPSPPGDSLLRLGKLAETSLQADGFALLWQGVFYPRAPEGLDAEAIEQIRDTSVLEGPGWLAAPINHPSHGLLLVWHDADKPWTARQRKLLEEFAVEAGYRSVEENWAGHLDRVSESVYLLDRDFTVRYINRWAAESGARHTGRRPDELVGAVFWDLFPDALQTRFYTVYKKAMESGTSQQLSEHYEPLDIWLEQTIYPCPEGLIVYSRNVTEQQRRELTLREQEELFRSILDRSSAAIFVKDEEGRYLEVNRRVTQIFNLPREQIIGRSVGEIHPPHIAERLERHDREVWKDRQPIQREEMLIENGELKTFLTAKFPVVAQGKLAVCGIATDITERVELARQLKEERARFEFVLEGADLGVWLCDLPTGQFWWDDRCRAHFGCPPGTEVTLDSIFEYIVPEDRERVRQAIEIALKQRNRYNSTYRTRGIDGLQRWIRGIGRCFYDDNGAPTRFDGITLDVTQQYNSEQALQRSEERYRSLVRATASIVWLSDAQGRFTQPQGDWELYTGQTWEQYRDFGWIGAVHTDDREKVWQEFQEALENRKLYRSGGRLWHTPGGEYRYFEVRAVPLLADEGSIKEWVGTVTDVQEQREAELAATQANRMKSEFLANMSHELRTPMTGVQGMLELLFDTPLEPQQKRFLEVIKDCSNSLLAVLDDVLDLSRIEAGKLMINDRPYELRASIASTLALFTLQAEERALQLHVNIAPEVPDALMGDPDRIRQVLVNLVSNAMKFTAEGFVELNVGLRNSWLRFEVRDTGIGIRPDDLERLFVPFVQLDSSSSRRYSGTGLGLSIVRRLIELMGGELGVESVYGEGSTFWFHLPVRHADKGSGAPADSDPTPPSAPGGRVLLVEDNPINRKVLAAQIEKLGIEVQSVELGTHAISLLRDESFDMIFMDCQMPELDGYETTRRLREQGVTTPIVALTAHAMEGERERCLAAGMDDYLNKPLAQKDLLRKLNQWLRLERSQKPGSSSGFSSDNER